MPPSVDGNSLDRLNAALAGRYRLERVLGHGGMATVYLADDLRHDRRVAVKIIHPELANALVAERFLREIRIEAQLTHPNIITLLDSGVIEAPPDPPRAFYVMPYVEGESLRERVRREGSLPVDEAVQITREVAAALDYAHRQGVIHRDIKPENILLVAGRPVVADFGVARLRSATGLTGLSSGALALGTPYYMSPEQWSSDPRLDGRSDIYSLGCVLYEMLAGEPPFTGATVEAIRARHAAEPPRPLRTIRPSVPDQVIVVIERAMAKVPADRFATAGELAAALGGELQIRRPRRRRGILLGAFALAVGAAALLLWLRPDPTLNPDRFVVLPFQERGGQTGGLVSGDAAAREVRNALGRWRDLTIASNLLLADVLGRRSPPRSLRDGLAIARSLRAGYLVWGEVWSSLDTTYVQAGLYDVTRRGAIRREHTIPLVAGPVRSQFSALADSLVQGALPQREGAGSAVAGTSSFEALRAYAAGDSALATWNLELAAERLRAALAVDPEYPQANLQLAQLLHWQQFPPGEWRLHAETAVRGADRLSVTDSGYADALLSLAEARYPTSCDRYRILLERDSLDFAAWFGLGECQARDSLVLRDPRSPSGWRFRSSSRAALEAYARALSLVPSVHRAYQGAAFDRLGTLLYTESHRHRSGETAGPEPVRFAAFPSLDHDTLAFVPFPSESVFRGRPGTVPASRHAAVDRNRERLREIAGAWIHAFPRSVPALRLWALALETSGDLGLVSSALPTAREAIREVRRRASGRAESQQAAVWEVRLLLKSGSFAEAKALADSTLTQQPASAGSAARFAGLAALTGRVHRAADLLARSAEIWDPLLPNQRPVSVPTALKASALRLLTYGAFGEPVDSLRALETRIRRDVDRFASAEQREQFLTALLHRPSLYAWEALEHPVLTGYLGPALAGLIHGDTAGVRRLFAAIRIARQGQRAGDVSLDITHLEARVLLAIGDSAAALAWLRPSVEALPSLGRYLLDEITQAAAVGRAMASVAQLSAAAGQAEAARTWARHAVTLWAEADPELQPTVRSLRRLAGG